jgi:hypothetical protein
LVAVVEVVHTLAVAVVLVALLNQLLPLQLHQQFLFLLARVAQALRIQTRFSLLVQQALIRYLDLHLPLSVAAVEHHGQPLIKPLEALAVEALRLDRRTQLVVSRQTRHKVLLVGLLYLVAVALTGTRQAVVAEQAASAHPLHV